MPLGGRGFPGQAVAEFGAKLLDGSVDGGQCGLVGGPVHQFDGQLQVTGLAGRERPFLQADQLVGVGLGALDQIQLVVVDADLPQFGHGLVASAGDGLFLDEGVPVTQVAGRGKGPDAVGQALGAGQQLIGQVHGGFPAPAGVVPDLDVMIAHSDHGQHEQGEQRVAGDDQLVDLADAHDRGSGGSGSIGRGQGQAEALGLLPHLG